MSKPNKKQPFRPFAPIAKELAKAATPAPKERVTHKHYVRHGNDDPKETIPKVRDWAFRQPKDGRAGQSQRAKNIKLTHTFKSSNNLFDLLMDAKVGTPECRWTITANLGNPANEDETTCRPLTSRDTIYLLQYLWQDYFRQNEEIEIEWNQNHRVLHIIDDLHKIITSDATKELGTPLNER